MEDYVLTVAVSLAAGAASLASAFPVLASHLLEACLGGLVLLTAVNLWGIAESAKFLMLPMVLFVCALAAAVIVGIVRSHRPRWSAPCNRCPSARPWACCRSSRPSLRAALPGVEAIANGVPSFREPRAERARRTELMLGTLLGPMLIGLAVLIVREHIAPRAGVTVLAQATAGSFGNGWAYSAANIRRARARPGREHRLRRPAGPDEPAG